MVCHVAESIITSVQKAKAASRARTPQREAEMECIFNLSAAVGLALRSRGLLEELDMLSQNPGSMQKASEGSAFGEYGVA